jgi:hypothetical protein
MPIPRTPGAPYFDERGVRAFLDCILQHGSNAGITNADELVSFLVRVREVVQYIPEIDPDEPNRSWSAAREQMLLLYGSSDEERRASERDLIEFCREQSAKSPYRSKLAIQQYLHDFQFIAAPLVKQQEITIAQRDFYFVSGIPTSIKEWFIDHVPESQRTRSNPIPLADTIGILYGYFDPDTLFPDLWDELDRTTNSIAPSPAPRSPFTPLKSSTPAPSIASTTVHHAPPPPTPKVAPVPSPASPTTSWLDFDAQDTPRIEEVDSDSDASNPREDFSVDDEYKVLPSGDLEETLVIHVGFGSRQPPIAATQTCGNKLDESLSTDLLPFATSCSVPSIALDTPTSPKIEPTLWDLDYTPDPREDSSTDEKFKVLPSANRCLQGTCQESLVDSCEEYSNTDRISGLCWALNETQRL